MTKPAKQPTIHPAYAELAALIHAMRPDWDLRQIIAELVGCPWSLHLAVEAVRATREDDDRLRVRDAVIRIPSQVRPVTDAQLAAYHGHAQRILSRKSPPDDGT